MWRGRAGHGRAIRPYGAPLSESSDRSGDRAYRTRRQQPEARINASRTQVYLRKCDPGREGTARVRMEWTELPAAELDPERTVAALDDAAASTGDPELACRALTRAAALCLHEADDVHLAALRLEQARRARPRPGGDAWTRCALTGVDLR